MARGNDGRVLSLCILAIPIRDQNADPSNAASIRFVHNYSFGTIV